MMAQGLKQPRAGSSSGRDATQAGADAIIVSCRFCGCLTASYDVLVHMKEAHADGSQQPSAPAGHSGLNGHCETATGRLGDGSIARPISIRIKEAQTMAAPAASFDTGGLDDIGYNNASDSTTESDVNSVFNSDGDRRRDNNDTDTSHEQDADEEQLRFAQCPVDGCMETVLADEMGYHMDIHSAIEYEQQPLGDVAVDTPIEDAHASRPVDTAASALPEFCDGYVPGPSRSSRHREVSTKSAKQHPDKQGREPKPKELKELKEPSGSRHRAAADERHDQHRERRERQRSGRDSLSHHSAPPPAKQKSSSRKSSTASSRPWWYLLAISTSKKSATAEGKAKEVLSLAKGAPSPPKRLGKAELGKYADEERMPDKLAVYLKKEWGICHRGIIPVLKQLLEQSPTTEYAYLCDPCVQHVSRLPQEGGFCGYRNLQTVISYIVGARFPGHGKFGGDLPSVFDLQNLIEEAWDMGINTRGRVETGGIRWTRKYIGTPEAVTLFRSLDIPCTVRSFKHKKPERARDLLLREVEQYFQMGRYKTEHKVRATTLPPIYWQHPGHSLTIVGIEKTTTGETNLLVFDPIFRDGSSVVRIVGRRRLVDYFPDQLLKSYRRGSRYLSKYRAFEILKLQPKIEDLAPASFGN